MVHVTKHRMTVYASLELLDLGHGLPLEFIDVDLLDDWVLVQLLQEAVDRRRVVDAGNLGGSEGEDGFSQVRCRHELLYLGLHAVEIAIAPHNLVDGVARQDELENGCVSANEGPHLDVPRLQVRELSHERVFEEMLCGLDTKQKDTANASC